jgi:DnaJ-class molecular chaperone
MKTFETENYYDILQILPNAARDEIRHAYRQALDIYDVESVATYTLFSDQQRETLLTAIEKAFETLVDDEKRDAYDKMLIDSGELDPAAFSGRSRRMPAAGPDNTREESIRKWVSQQAGNPDIRQRIDAIHSGSQTSGPQLKALRESYGIELSDIYAITRINRDVMMAIEADRFEDLPALVYLKQFLKSYAQILQIDTRHVVECYLKAMAGSEPQH